MKGGVLDGDRGSRIEEAWELYKEGRSLEARDELVLAYVPSSSMSPGGSQSDSPPMSTSTIW